MGAQIRGQVEGKGERQREPGSARGDTDPCGGGGREVRGKIGSRGNKWEEGDSYVEGGG